MSFKPTEEQTAIVDLALEGEDLVINAFSGASKTTTLTLIAEAKDAEGGEAGMYLAFNKAIAVESENRFPSSVECRTVHSLAYKHTPKDLIKKLANQKIFPKDFSALYKFNGSFVDNGDGNDGGVQKFISAGAKMSMVNRTVSRFCNSADPELLRSHVCKLDWMFTDIGKTYHLDAIMEEVFELSKLHWENIIDPKSIVPMTHEGYLKLYSMSGRAIIADYIMIDENQDSSPVILNIIENQKKAQKIYVGDKYQAIYAWRGAVNAMNFVTGESVYLTKSFRFGDNVEKIANLFLDHAGNEKPLVGNGTKDGKIYINNMPMTPSAVISRTNAGVIKNIFDYSERYPNATLGASCNLQEIEKFAKAYEKLKAGEKIEHPLLFAFEDIDELMKYCDENPEDLEISGLVKLIEKFTVKGLIGAVKRCESAKKPDIMITTAHKSKGLEWDNVVIHDDFFFDVSEGSIQLDSEELNLLYVSCTRAKKNLDIGGISSLIFRMVHNQAKYELLPEFGFTSGDDVADATGGVLTELMVNNHELQAKAMYFLEKGTKPNPRELGAFIDKHSKYHEEAQESWLEHGEGSFGGKIHGVGGVLLDDPNAPELTTF